jgi:propanol-preferring alcohol dehydrogenase
MKAMVLTKVGKDLELQELDDPAPGANQVLIDVTTCGVCRTDLHVFDGELNQPKLPLVLGHEIVGKIVALGEGVSNLQIGEKVGVPWLGGTCGHCRFCMSERENLCDNAIFTGYQRNGGYATKTVANAQFCFRLPETLPDSEIAPMLCAGLIGWRTLKLAGHGKRLGIYGFGGAAHIVIQVAIFQGWDVYALTREGDEKGQAFAKRLGACWAGSSSQFPAQKLDAALIFAPVGSLIPQALKAAEKGATIVSGGIHISDIPSFPYADLWEERVIKSVANLTRADAHEFFAIAAQVPVHTSVKVYPLEAANQALADLRAGKLEGAAVLKCQ